MKRKVRITKETYVWKNESDEGVIYYKDGKKHREDGPAVEFLNGDEHWYLNGYLHREEGPAIEYANGSKEWYLEGLRHREDGAAVEWSDGSRFWFRHDKRHRVDGPAIEWFDGDSYWFLDGINYTEDEFNQWLCKKALNEKLNAVLGPRERFETKKI